MGAGSVIASQRVGAKRIPNRHRPRKRMIQYSRDVRDGIDKPRRGGYGAGACPWAGRRRDPVAGQDNQFGAKPALLLAIAAFPINPKRFMVPAGFAVGK